jgi:phosphoribosyl 1,2-cyclic phosphate phosphodiesterase
VVSHSKALPAEATAEQARLVFLGTGASGGTPGTGRSHRLESSLLVEATATVLFDVTRDFGEQSRHLRRLDAVLITHAHRDAAGGIPALARWLGDRAPVRVLAAPETISMLQLRHRRLGHCHFVPTPPGRRRQIGPWIVQALEVPHADDPDYPTYAWRLRGVAGTLVYASDVARLTTGLRRFVTGADVLVVDGATWRRTIFSHLRIDRDLPSMCTWDVRRIRLTQIGRSAPRHEDLSRAVRLLCGRARPASDGLVERLRR